MVNVSHVTHILNLILNTREDVSLIFVVLIKSCLKMANVKLVIHIQGQYFLRPNSVHLTNALTDKEY